MTWTDTLCLGMCAVYSFFGITLAISMRSFWGPDSPGFSYWNVADASGEWFARALGIWMTVLTSSPYWAGMDKSVLAKIYIIPNVLFVSLGLFVREAVNWYPLFPPLPSSPALLSFFLSPS